jgi:type I restriction enzyme M protein
MEMFDTKAEVEHIATTIDNTKIAENYYDLSVNSYVEPIDTREKTNIEGLNKELTKTVNKIDELRSGIENIANEIEA